MHQTVLMHLGDGEGELGCERSSNVELEKSANRCLLGIRETAPCRGSDETRVRSVGALNAETIENRGNQVSPSGLFLKGGILQTGYRPRGVSRQQCKI
jgi:hypothetical protein